MKKLRSSPLINSGSMADIAFLLLIFFLVTTTIVSDKGLMLLLPQAIDIPDSVPIKEKNLFKILINNEGDLMVEGERMDGIDLLKSEVKAFVMNMGTEENLSESPEKAIVSLKTNRAANYAVYINALDQIQGAYYEIYAERAGITPEEFRKLDKKDPKKKQLYDKARKGIPMNISIANGG